MLRRTNNNSLPPRPGVSHSAAGEAQTALKKKAVFQNALSSGQTILRNPGRNFCMSGTLGAPERGRDSRRRRRLLGLGSAHSELARTFTWAACSVTADATAKACRWLLSPCF